MEKAGTTARISHAPARSFLVSSFASCCSLLKTFAHLLSARTDFSRTHSTPHPLTRTFSLLPPTSSSLHPLPLIKGLVPSNTAHLLPLGANNLSSHLRFNDAFDLHSAFTQPHAQSPQAQSQTPARDSETGRQSLLLLLWHLQRRFMVLSASTKQTIHNTHRYKVNAGDHKVST